MIEFDRQHSRLDTIHPRIPPHSIMVIFSRLSMIPQHAQGFGENLIVCHNGSGISVCSQIFTGIKTETTQVPHGSGWFSIERRPMCLGGILDYPQSILSRKSQNRIHIRHLPIQVNRQDGACSGRQGSREILGVQGKGLGIDIDEDLARRYPVEDVVEQWTQARLPDGSPARP